MKKPELKRRPKGIRLVRIACVMIERELHETDLRANKRSLFYCYDPALIAVFNTFFVLTRSCKNSFLPLLPVGAIIGSFGRNLFNERDRQNSSLVFVSTYNGIDKVAVLNSNLPTPITVETNFRHLKQ